MTTLSQSYSSSINMSLEKLALIETMSHRAKCLCSFYGLLTLQQIIGYWQTHHTFRTLKGCSITTDLELATICAKYLLRQNESEAHIHPAIQKSTPIQKIMFCQLLAVSILGISRKSLNLLTAELNGTIPVRDMFGVVYKTIWSQNIAPKKKKCANELLDLDMCIFKFISAVKHDEEHTISKMYDKAVQLFSKKGPGTNLFNPECVLNTDGTIRFFQLIDLLIQNGLVFSDKYKQVFLSYFANPKNINSALYRRKRDVELYIKLYSWLFSFLFLHAPHHYHPDSDFIILNKDYTIKLNTAEGVNFNDGFYSRILRVMLQSSHSLLCEAIGTLGGRKNLSAVYFVKNDLLSLYDWNKFFEFIIKTTCEKRDSKYLLSLDHVVKLYTATEDPDQINRITHFCKILLLNELELSIDDQDNIVFFCNEFHSALFYVKKFLNECGTAKTLDEIIDELRNNAPHLSIKKASLQARIRSNAETFIFFGKSGKIGLKIWEETDESVKGGSLTTAAKKCLEGSPEPLHKDEISNK
ncbi:hypothetical protein [Niastella sp. OAS944]|uniref:hypothetical protein n=1 Tax=Niastella sp. OAS944 TaxID=2664089 RepID=UPI00346E879A|nr:hypothetical protein [Chitinophagaceae bacterium OAS944]